MSLYGWLIGSRKMDAVIYRDNGPAYQGKGEIYFGWVLEGRAIQDVWIVPDFFFMELRCAYTIRGRRVAHFVERSVNAILHASNRK
jgi:hypothetical protein